MIYLDHNAKTPIALEVREAMLPYLTEEWGNQSSSYRFGYKCQDVIGSGGVISTSFPAYDDVSKLFAIVFQLGVSTCDSASGTGISALIKE